VQADASMIAQNILHIVKGIFGLIISETMVSLARLIRMTGSTAAA